MSKHILSVAPMLEQPLRALDDSHTIHRLYEAGDRNGFLAQIGADIGVVATTGFDGASAQLMDALPNLGLVACLGVGVDAIDLAHAASRNIAVTNTPDVLNDDVANLAVALLLASTRDIVVGDRYVRDGSWQTRGTMALSRGIRNKTIGILGLGRIGADIAAKLVAFGPNLVYHGRRRQADKPYVYYDSLIEMARDSDHLIVACPATPQTIGIVGEEVLDALGAQGTLINIARGSIVDEPALVKALETGRLGAAALDVFVDEPNVPTALFEMDNVVLQPHVGSATRETRQAMGDLVVRNIELHFAGAPVETPVAG